MPVAGSQNPQPEEETPTASGHRLLDFTMINAHYPTLIQTVAMFSWRRGTSKQRQLRRRSMLLADS